MKLTLLLLILNFLNPLFVFARVIGSDQRIPSYDLRVGRLIFGKVHACSGALVSPSCFVSVEHCERDAIGGNLTAVEFEIFVNGAKSSPEKVFPVVSDSIRSGSDWMVLRLGKNAITGRYPGDSQGYFRIADFLPESGALISVIGYGLSFSNERRKKQQSGQGQMFAVSALGTFFHNADTTASNSGSPVVDSHTDLLLGVHNSESSNLKFNIGTSVLATGFANELQKCLQYSAQP